LYTRETRNLYLHIIMSLVRMVVEVAGEDVEAAEEGADIIIMRAMSISRMNGVLQERKRRGRVMKPKSLKGLLCVGNILQSGN
jgi:hypothetical protein